MILHATFLACIALLSIDGCLCEESDVFYYLPKNVKPIRYNFTLEPLLGHSTLQEFEGSIIIDLKALEQTNYITLHSKELDIVENSIEVIDAKGEHVNVSNVDSNEIDETYTIHLQKELQKDETYKLRINKFVGSLNHEKFGFFYATYFDRNDTLRYMVVTEFESRDARAAFPCFDEPALRATFVVNLIRPEGYISVSNEELLNTIDLGNGRFQDVYKETVSMPTYLVAFSISEFKTTEKNGKIQIISRPEAIDAGDADYMLGKSVKILEALEDYLGINYTLNKLDLLTVPEGYFLDGAMENWGLIIYRETHLLYSNSSSTINDLQRCLTYSAHEFAHQWFGNLVTPKKWNYMWLSEGFASYFQYHIADVIEPTWRLPEQYVVDEYQVSLKNDVVPFSEPINYVFTSKDGFPSAMSMYYKASAVIRMASHFLTKAVFQDGLRIYLSKCKFGVAEPADLYDAFQQAVDNQKVGHLLGNLSVAEILLNWHTNIGFPVVTVTRNYETGSITFSQESYTSHYSNEIVDDLWHIPINFVMHNKNLLDFSETTSDIWLSKAKLTIQGSITDDWILINKHQTGYYRTNYDLINWNRIIDFLKSEDFELIPPVNRAQLIDDAFTFTQSDKLDYEIFLNLITYLRQETDYIPLKTFFDIVNSLHLYIPGLEKHELFLDFIKNLLNKACAKVGLEDKDDDTHIDRLTRMLLIMQLCQLKDSRCNIHGLKKVKQWQETGSINISANIERELICGAIQVATLEDWEFVFEQYLITKDVEVKRRYLKALACSQNITIINKYLEIICDLNNTMTDEERYIGYGSMAEFSEIGLERVIDYAVRNTTICTIRLPTSSSVDQIAMAISDPFSIKFKAMKGLGCVSELSLIYYKDVLKSESQRKILSKIHTWAMRYKQSNAETTNTV